MKKIFEWTGGLALILFSFYFTDRISLLVAGKSDLMVEIKSVSNSYEEKPVNAIIDEKNNTIIPGKYGKKVNSKESYLNMHDFGSFNEKFLVFDEVKPNITLNENKDKIIKEGNSMKRQISLVIENNVNTIKYLETNNIKYDLALDSVTSDTKELKYATFINSAISKNEFDKINRNFKDIEICLLNDTNENYCKKKGLYLISPKITLDEFNLTTIKNSIKSGSIVFIKNTATLENIQYLINEIRYKDLEIVHTYDIIREN